MAPGSHCFPPGPCLGLRPLVRLPLSLGVHARPSRAATQSLGRGLGASEQTCPLSRGDLLGHVWGMWENKPGPAPRGAGVRRAHTHSPLHTHTCAQTLTVCTPIQATCAGPHALPPPLP